MSPVAVLCVVLATAFVVAIIGECFTNLPPQEDRDDYGEGDERDAGPAQG